jgi:hypothetical protein
VTVSSVWSPTPRAMSSPSTISAAACCRCSSACSRRAAACSTAASAAARSCRSAAAISPSWPHLRGALTSATTRCRWRSSAPIHGSSPPTAAPSGRTTCARRPRAWWARQDVLYFFHARLLEGAHYSDGMIGYVLARAPGQPAFSAEDEALAARLQPALQAAARRCARTLTSAQAQQTLEGLIEGCGRPPTLAADLTGRLLWASTLRDRLARRPAEAAGAARRRRAPARPARARATSSSCAPTTAARCEPSCASAVRSPASRSWRSSSRSPGSIPPSPRSPRGTASPTPRPSSSPPSRAAPATARSAPRGGPRWRRCART